MKHFNHIIFGLILFIPILLFSSGTSAERLKCPCTVVQILKGDIIFVLDQHRSSRKIWMAGINAPEMNDKLGKEARDKLVNTLEQAGVEVFYIQRDRYGRIIGKVLKDGIDINRQQIMSGYARYSNSNPETLSSEDHQLYKQAELFAKSRRLGIWSE